MDLKVVLRFIWYDACREESLYPPHGLDFAQKGIEPPNYSGCIIYLEVMSREPLKTGRPRPAPTAQKITGCAN